MYIHIGTYRIYAWMHNRKDYVLTHIGVKNSLYISKGIHLCKCYG